MTATAIDALSSTDKRLLTGIIREKYADTIRRLKKHRAELEAGRQDHNKNYSHYYSFSGHTWFRAKLADITAEIVNAAVAEHGAETKKVFRAKMKAHDKYETAQARSTFAHNMAKVRKDLKTQITSLKEQLANETLTATQRSLVEANIASLKASRDSLKAYPKLNKKFSEQKAGLYTQMKEADEAYDDLVSRTGLAYDGVDFSSARNLNHFVVQDAKRRMEKIDETIEILHEQSRAQRTDIALTAMDSPEAAQAILGAIPTDINSLLNGE